MKTILFFLLCFCTAAFGQFHGVVSPPGPTKTKTVAQASPQDMPGVVFSPGLVRSMKCLLWSEAEEDIKSGPVDYAYFSLTKDQIEDLFSFVKARREHIPYIAEAWDCDDFALEFHYLARLWAVRSTRGVQIAPAVGMAFVKLDGPYPFFEGEPYVMGVYHVINVILRNDGQWFFVEPQNGRILPIEGSIYEGAIEVIKIVI